MGLFDFATKRQVEDLKKQVIQLQKTVEKMAQSTAQADVDLKKFIESALIKLSINPIGAVPAAPTGVSALSGAAQVALSWQAVAIGNVTGYDVYRSTQSTIGFTKITASPVTATTYTDTGRANGTIYYYYIVAKNAFGDSLPSLTLSATPQNLETLLAPSDITAYSVASNRVNLIWDQDNSTDNFSYRIERSTDAQASWQALATKDIISATQGPDIRLTTAERYHVDNNIASVAANGTIHYRIRCEAGSNYSPWTTVSCVKKGATIAAAATSTGLAAAMAAATANSGDEITFSVDQTFATRVQCKPGVSVRGIGTVKINYTDATEVQPEGALHCEAATMTNWNAQFSNFMIDCGDWDGWNGLSAKNTSGIFCIDVSVSKSVWCGILGSINTKNFLVKGGTFTEAGFMAPVNPEDTWPALANASQNTSIVNGGINFRSNSKNVIITGANVICLQKGYGINFAEFSPPGGTGTQIMRNVMIYGNTVTAGNKAWNGGDGGQFAIQKWKLQTYRCYTFNNSLQNGVSFEHRNDIRPDSASYSVRFEGNYLSITRGGAFECSNHDIKNIGNLFDFRNMTAPATGYSNGFYGCIYDSNRPGGLVTDTQDQTHDNNLFILGARTPGHGFFAFPNRFTRLKIRNNTFAGGNYPAGGLLNIQSRESSPDENIDWVGLEIHNNAFAQTTVSGGFVDGGCFLIRKATYPAGSIMGTGQFSVTSATIRGNICPNLFIRVPPTAIVSGNTLAAPAFVTGSTDIRQMYRPLAGGNMVGTGYDYGQPIAGTLPDRGCYEIA